MHWIDEEFGVTVSTNPNAPQTDKYMKVCMARKFAKSKMLFFLSAFYQIPYSLVST